VILTVASLNAALDRSYPVTLAPDGNPIVHVGYGDAVLTTHDADHIWRNVPGGVEGMPTPAGSPITCRAGDCVILARRCIPGLPRPDYFPEAGKSEVSEMACISFVSYPAQGPLFRGFGIGSGLVQMLRAYAIPVAQMDLTRLPSVLEIPAARVAEMLPYLERIFAGFNGEVRSEWGTETITPDKQNPGYGSRFASCVSMGLVLLCSTIPVSAKRTLATRMVQWGLDLAGAFADGRRNKSNGGHMQGRKALVILAGHLLGIPQMTDPDRINPHFQETQGYSTTLPQGWWNGWKHVWHPFGPGSGSFVLRHPSTWTTVDPPGGRCEAFRLSYAAQVLACQVGTALAMRLMGRQREMGSSYIGMIAQWMEGPKPMDVAALAAAGLSYPWGTDYAVGPGRGMCADAWRSVGGAVL
jgi:hypothetical protein